MVHRTLSWLSPPSPSESNKAPEWLLIVLTVLAVLYCVMPLLEMRLPNAIEVLFALTGLYVLFRYGKGIRWSLPVKLMAVTVVLMVLSWVFMMIDHPDLARSGPSLEDFLDKFFFLFIALAVAGVERRALAFLGVFFLFVLLMPWLSGDGFSEIASGLKGVRTDFGINPIRTGLLFGAALLALICFAPRIFMRPRFSALKLAVWILLLGFCVTIVVITQSRTAMVALLPGLAAAMVLFLVMSPVSPRFKIGIALTLAAALAMFLWASDQAGLTDLVEKRFGREAAVIQQAIEGDLEDVPRTSWGIRIRLLVEGVDSLLERPLTGWGYRAGEIVLDKEGLRRGDGGVFSQVHNAYMEAALRYGIGATMVLLMLFGWALYGTWRSWKDQQMSLDMVVFLGSVFGYFMVANLFDGLLFQTEGVLLFNVLMGVAASYMFFNRRQGPPSEAIDDHPA